MSLLNPNSFTEGGTILDDADGTVTEAKWAMYNYGGKAAPAPGLVMSIEHDNGGKMEVSEQFWSCGNARDWMPAKDGKSITSPTGKSGLNKNSNVAILLASAVNAGFPADKLGDDPSVFVGLKAHWLRVAQDRKIEGGKESSTLTIARIVSLPGQTANSQASSSVNPELESQIQQYVLTVLAEAGGRASKADLSVKVFQKASGDKNPSAATFMSMLSTDAFIGKQGLGWSYANGIVSLA
jgi:hypothetical protein